MLYILINFIALLLINFIALQRFVDDGHFNIFMLLFLQIK